MFNKNWILSQDSYKVSQAVQYPANTTELTSYIESRGGPTKGNIFCGIQMFVKDLASLTLTKEMVDNAGIFYKKHLGPDIFQIDDWYYLIEKYNGKIPLEIYSVKEGEYIDTNNILVKVKSTDERLFWLNSFIETSLLRAIWYPTTVATISNNIKKNIYKFLLETSDDNSLDGQINFKLHSFGQRGVSSDKSAEIGEVGHLFNFMGSDTTEGIEYANYYYDSEMAGFSIPAMEHSTVTSWGILGETQAYQNMLNKFAKPNSLVACVADSYSIYNAIDNIFGEQLKQQIINSGATIVVRSDSGYPPTIVVECLKKLATKFGYQINSKGYKVLNNVRVLHGDGINGEVIENILQNVKNNNFAADNVAFGMGGALLQEVSRDTYKFAMKCCMAKVNGKYRDVFKDPVTDPGKRSKTGDLDLIKINGQYKTINKNFDTFNQPSELQLVYRNGELFNTSTLSEIRTRVNQQLEVNV